MKSNPKFRDNLCLAMAAAALVVGLWLIAGCETMPAISNEAMDALAAMPEEDITPDTIAELTGGAVTSDEVIARAEELQRDNPQWDWGTVLIAAAGTLGVRKFAPHLLGPVAPWLAGLNPLFGLISSLALSTSEMKRNKDWREGVRK